MTPLKPTTPRMFFITAIVFFSSLMLSLCETRDSQPPPILDEIAATVDGEPIMRSDVETMMLQLRADETRPAPPPAGGISDTPGDLASEALDELINERLILKAAEQKEIKPSDQEMNQLVDEKIARLRKSFATKTEFDRFMDEQGLTLDSLRHELRKRAEKDYIIRTAVSRRFSITDDDVKQFEAHLRELKKPLNAYHIQHILLRCPKNADSESEQRVLNRARELLIRLKQGESFDSLANNESEDQATRTIGGDLGFLNDGEFLPPLEQAVRNLTLGDIAGPVRTNLGFHIVKLLEKRTARWQLFKQRFDEEKLKWADQLRQKAIINISTTYRRSTAGRRN